MCLSFVQDAVIQYNNSKSCDSLLWLMSLRGTP